MHLVPVNSVEYLTHSVRSEEDCASFVSTVENFSQNFSQTDFAKDYNFFSVIFEKLFGLGHGGACSLTV